MILSPAYGRDYKSAKAAKADFFADKDFIIEDMMNPWSGKPVNRPQLGPSDYPIELRFKQMRSLTMIKAGDTK